MGKYSKRLRNKQFKAENALETFFSALILPYPFESPQDMREALKDSRRMVEVCYKNFRYYDSDKKNVNRFVLYPYFIFFAFESGFESKVKKRLKKIARDENELTYFRVEAFFLLAVQQKGVDPEEEAFLHEEVVLLCKKATQEEKNYPLPPSLVVKTEYETVGEHLASRQEQSEKIISELYNEKRIVRIRSREEIAVVPWSAGDRCDYCEKTKAALNRDRLLCSMKCQFEYYCSKECQKMPGSAGINTDAVPKGITVQTIRFWMTKAYTSFSSKSFPAKMHGLSAT